MSPEGPERSGGAAQRLDAAAAVAFPARTDRGRLTRPLPRRRGRRRPACGRPATSVGARRCTTRFSNTHSTAERRILYEFHPWSGQEVAVDRVVAKGGGAIARCGLPGSTPRLLLEVPLWMFDRQSCSTVRRRERPHVDLTTLQALADLLSKVVHDDGSDPVPSTVADRHADLGSRDRRQGADHATTPPEARPAGSVRSSGRRPTSRHAAMAESAGPDEAAGGGSDGSDAAGAPRQPSRASGCRDRRGEPGRGEQ